MIGRGPDDVRVEYLLTAGVIPEAGKRGDGMPTRRGGASGRPAAHDDDARPGDGVSPVLPDDQFVGSVDDVDQPASRRRVRLGSAVTSSPVHFRRNQALPSLSSTTSSPA